MAINYPYGMPYQPFMPQPNQNQAQQYNNMNNVNNMNNMGNMNNMMYQQPQPQTSYLPLTFTSGVVGAKSFIVAPNQTVYLRDSDENSNLLFEKSADANGKYTLKAYRLTQVELDNSGNPMDEIKKQDVITKTDLEEFATKKELINLQKAFEKEVNNLSYLILKSPKMPINEGVVKDRDKDDE